MSDNINSSSPSLFCSNVNKSYSTRRGTIHVLHNVSLNVYPQTITAIQGRSGAGKSTLLSLLGGLDKPDSGSIIAFGENMTLIDHNRLAKIRGSRFGFLFQNHNLIRSWTALENVEAALIPQGVSPVQRKTTARSLLARVGLEARETHLPDELSAGQQQRVALARAIIRHPDILFADEPTGDLDEETSRELLILLQEEIARGMALVVATHGIFPLQAADTLFSLSNGELIQS